MSKYHISPASGEPKLCRAKHKCPFGGEDEHYVSKEEARQAYEQKQTPEIASISKNKTYSSSEVEQLVPGFVASEERTYRLEEVSVSELSDGILVEDLPEDYSQEDEASIQRLEAAYRAGERLPPLVCDRDSIFGGLELVDGNHRLNAAQRVGLATIASFVEVVEEKSYGWPQSSETRSFASTRTPGGEVILQVSDHLGMESTHHKLQAWLTTPEEGTVGYVCMLVHGEGYYEGIGEHLVVSDIEVRPDQRGRGFARELEESLARETSLPVYYSGSFTPEGWQALGKHARYYPHMEGESAWDKPGEKFSSMGFVASWKEQVPRYPERAIDYSDEQRDAMWRLSEEGVFKKLDDKEMLWAEK